MEAAFTEASEDLSASLNLDNRPLLTYAQEMDVCQLSGRRRAHPRHSGEPRSRSILTNIIVREKYMGTLAPRWGGSVEAMHAFLEESKQAGVSAAHLQSLEGVIIEDQAHTEKDAGDYAAAERDYRKLVALGNENCLLCLAETLSLDGKSSLTRFPSIPSISKRTPTTPLHWRPEATHICRPEWRVKGSRICRPPPKQAAPMPNANWARTT